MGSRTGRGGVPGRLTLGRVFISALTLLVVAVTGGLPTQQVRAQGTETGPFLYLKFSDDTPPIEPPNVLCQGNKYKILAQYGIVLQGVRNRVPYGIIARGILNPLNPDSVYQGAHWPAAIIYYDAKNTGDDVVSFTGGWALPPEEGSRLPRLKETKHLDFPVKVKPCEYKVTFVYSWQMALGGDRFAQFGHMEETRLTPKEDGTLAGSGVFDLSQVGSLSGCSAVNFSDVPVTTHVSGKRNQDTHELALSFTYDKATLSASASCDGGSGGGSKTLDVSQGGLTQATFPEIGGTQEFSTEAGGPPGKLTVIVTQEVTNVQ